MSPSAHAFLAYAALTLTSLLWAATAVVGRAINEAISPAAIVFWQWGLAVLIAYPFVRSELIERRAILRRNWRQLALLGLMGTATIAACIMLALRYTTASNVSMLNSTIPVWVLVAVWLRHGTAPSARSLVGFAISMSGILAIVLHGSLDKLLALELNPGDLITLVAMMVWGAYSVLLKERPPELSSLAFLVVTGAFGVAAILPFYAIDLVRGTAHPAFGWGTALAIAYLVLFRTLLGTLTYNYGIDGVGPSRAAVFVHLMPVFGSLLAFVFLGERLAWYHFAGLALVLTGIYIANRRFA